MSLPSLQADDAVLYWDGKERKTGKVVAVVPVVERYVIILGKDGFSIDVPLSWVHPIPKDEVHG